MPRPNRLQSAGAHYHVIARGVAGTAVFVDDFDRERFRCLLELTSARMRWRVHAFTLMTTHVHTLVETPEPNIARGMQYLLGTYAQGFNHRWARFGHLFSERYTSRVVEGEAHFRYVAEYIFDNPIAAGLSDSRVAWPWSGGLLFSAMARGLTLGPVPFDSGEQIHSRDQLTRFSSRSAR